MRLAAAALALPLMLGSTAAAATGVELKIGRIEGAALPFALADVRVSCRLEAADKAVQCAGGKVALSSAATGTVLADFSGSLWHDANWSATVGVAAEHVDLRGFGVLLQRQNGLAGSELSGSARVQARATRNREGAWLATYDVGLRAMSFNERSGRYASDKLDLNAHGEASLEPRAAAVHLRLSSSSGQAYVEPVFVDLAAAPAEADVRLSFDLGAGASMPAGIRSVSIDARQRGVVDHLLLSGSLSGLRSAPAFGGDVRVVGAHLDTLLKSYAAPFLAGDRWQDIDGAGSAGIELKVSANRPTAVAIRLADIGIKAGTPALQADGLTGELYWQETGAAPVSNLSWRGLQYGDLPVAAASISARAQGRDFALLRPPRLPILGGALIVDTLQLSQLGTADLQARFAATIEPIDLAALCRALGWPQFGGELSGRIPGVSIRGQELAFDGGLSIKAFDGEIGIEALRMPEVFGRLPRVLADLRLRNLDLKAITQAFSFGRIEGRLSGDIEGLRLLNWAPVAFDARLYTPAGDRSRHRISQRAIDNLSSLGGGPSGLLQRGVLRFFEDFGYARIGWSCRLENGVCVMDGIEAAGKGGYVLVEGRLLPRIDVIGYERRVDWNRFVAQLLAIRGAKGVEVR
jgi:hypothetical protein